MNISKEVYRYLEHELSHYEYYKKEFELEMADGNRKSMVVMLSLNRIITAIERTLERLNDKHKMLFDEIYNKRRTDIDNVCKEFNISRKTFARHKQRIMYGVGYELGLIWSDQEKI